MANASEVWLRLIASLVKGSHGVMQSAKLRSHGIVLRCVRAVALALLVLLVLDPG